MGVCFVVDGYSLRIESGFWVGEGVLHDSDHIFLFEAFELEPWLQDMDLSPANVPELQPGTGSAEGSDTIMRLREGIERFLVTDIDNPAATAMAQSSVAVMWDQLGHVEHFNHVPGGCNVLFMDGHVKFLRYPNTRWPVTKAFAQTSREVCDVYHHHH